jgi:hypothetical protein
MIGKRNKATRGKKSSSLEKAYIAGLLDGEGCINIYRINTKRIEEIEGRKNPKYILSVTIYNCHYGVIKWLHEQYGGYLQTRYRNPKTWRTNYAWKVSANIALDFLKEVQKYMKIKSEQAKIAIKFQEKQSRFHKEKKTQGLSSEEHAFREECWLELKRLNQLISPAETKSEDTER